MVLAACGAATHAATNRDVTTTATVKLVKEGHAALTVLVDSVPTTLDSHLQVGGNYASKMIDSLIWPSPFLVMPGNIPQLDTSIVSSAVVTKLDPETVVYTINPSAVWSDGSPVTAEDFIQLWHAIMMSSSWRPDIGYRDIASVTGNPGGKTVTVVFGKPYGEWSSLFNNLLPGSLYPTGASGSGGVSGASASASGASRATSVSASLASKVGAGQASLSGASGGIGQEFPLLNSALVASPTHPLVSAGPFQVVGFTPGKSIVLDSNPRWWGPVPSVSKIVIEGFRANANATLQSSSYDLAYMDTFDQNSLAQVTMQGNATNMVRQGPEEMQMLFNLASGQLTSSLPFRDGLAKIINRPDLVSQVVDPILPGSAPAGNYLYANGQSGYVSDSAGYDHPHPKDASSLFRALGMKITPPGLPGAGTWMLNASPVVLSIAWNVNDPWANQAGTLIASQLYSAGFEVRTLPVAQSVLDNSIIPSGDYTMVLMPVETGPFPSRMEGMYTPLPSSLTSPSSPVSTSSVSSVSPASPPLPSASSTSPGYSIPSSPQDGSLPLVYGNGSRIDVNNFYDPAVSVLFSRAERHMNPMRSAPVYQQVDMLLWHDMPSLPLFTIPVITVHRNWIAGVSSDVDGPGPFFDLAEWQILAVQATKVANNH
jgi:peptide/nickel transport system substrate-binding protein